MEIISSIVTKTFEYAIDAIFHQLGYCVHYKDNIEDLKEQVKHVEFVRSSVQRLIDEANDRVEEIHTHVRIRLSEVDKITEDLYKFLKKIEEENEKNCLNLVQRYRSSRVAKKMRNDLAMIQAELEKLDKVSHRGPLPWIDSVLGYQTFKSRMSIMEKIMKALEDPNINMIGVHGMGGIGKTMLVKEISCHVSKSKLFGLVIMAIVGQNPDVKHVQGQLADMLRFEFKEETEEGRASSLRNRLQKEEKILIIIDDVWNGLDLEGVGIPSSHSYKGIKIIVTSRSKQVLSNEMSIENNFMVEDLTQEESWNLFKNMVDESFETNNQLEKIAKDVANKCGKLPLALVIVAKTLKGQPLPIWRNALERLKNPGSVGIEGVSNKVYASLKLSYDHLKSREAQLLFLLCSMFPDDYEIDISDLSRYTMGLKFLPGVNTLGGTRDTILTIVNDLESSYLLKKFERSDRQLCVKMHDVVRDVSIYIASKDYQMCTLSYGKGSNEWKDEKAHEHYTAVLWRCESLQDRPMKLSFPKLELLTLLNKKYPIHQLVREGFFEGLGKEKLKVLHLEGMCFSLMPSYSDCLVNLRTLLLVNCRLKNIDMIGELKNLEILDLSHSDITELPLSMGQLSRLKQLKVSDCKKLKVIPPNIISRMTKLEELYIDGSFDGWDLEEFDNREKKNESIRELGGLSRLTRLHFCIPNVRSLQEISFLNNLELECFQIFIGKPMGNYARSKNMLLIKTYSSNVLLNELWFNRLLKKCETLDLDEMDGVENILLELRTIVSPYLRKLILALNADVEYLMSESDEKKLPCNGFSNIEVLNLHFMPRLASIIQCYSFETVKVFEKLKKLSVANCSKMKYLFPLSIIDGLSNLEEIFIWECKMMEAIFMVIENESQTHKFVFRKLREVNLSKLPELKSFCGQLFRTKEFIQTAEIVEEEDPCQFVNSIIPFDCKITFPNLESVSIHDVKNLSYDMLIANNFTKLETISIYDSKNLESVFTDPNSKLKSSHLDNKPNLQSLSHVCFIKCPKLKTIFPHSLTKHLQQLQGISITHCGIDEIFSMAESELEYSKSKVSFPNFRSLEIVYVDNLKIIWPNQLVVDDLSNLRSVNLINCKSLKCVFTSNVMRALKWLDELHIQNCDSIEEVFEIRQMIKSEEDHEIVSISLKMLLLCNLPSLKHVWSNDPYGMYQFQDLYNVEVTGCPKLKTLFPPSLARDLPQQLQRFVCS